MSINEAKNWKFVGGDLSLDFINSVEGRVWQKQESPLNYQIISDKLNSFTDLVEWGKEIGILNDSKAKKLILVASQNDKAALNIFQRAIALRESIYRIFINIIERNNPQAEDINLLNNEYTFARAQQKLIYDTNKFGLDFGPDNTEPEIIIWQVALSAAELFLSEQINKVKQCPGDNCGWLFLDTSKNKSRQWCDMKDCGNLAKVRRYRKKKK